MAQGSMVDIVKIQYRFGMVIAEPVLINQDFRSYKEVYLSKNGTLIGKWGAKPYEYRGYISTRWKGYAIARKCDNYIFMRYIKK